MNIAQSIQRTLLVVFVKTGAVIALLPEVPFSFQYSIETHRGVPIDEVHGFDTSLCDYSTRRILDKCSGSWGSIR